MIQMFLFIYLSCLFLLLTAVSTHSWVECTDYDMSIDLEADDFDNSFDHSSCSGYARDRKWYTWHYYGFNSGIDFEVFVDGSQMCERSIGSPNDGYASTYDTTYPMASYTVGNTYRLIWPAKNHAGYECQSDQLDNAMQLWVNLAVNPTSDLGNNVNNDGWTLVIDWHSEYEDSSGDSFILSQCTDGDCNVQSYWGKDNVPFQNCPKFCDDTDNAVCYGDFTLPNIFSQDGYYTFVWYWEFKSNEVYSHCFEAYVSGTSATTETPVTDPDTTESEIDATEPITDVTESITDPIEVTQSPGVTDHVSYDSSDSSDITNTIDTYVNLSTESSDSSEDTTDNNNNSNKNETTDSEEAGSTIIWAMVAFIIVFLFIIIGCIVLQKQGYIVCKDNSIAWVGVVGNSKQAGSTAASNGALTQSVVNHNIIAIEPAADGDSGATTTTGAPPRGENRGVPPRPPRVVRPPPRPPLPTHTNQ